MADFPLRFANAQTQWNGFLVRSTYAKEEDARQAARALVESRQAACVHVQPIHSTYTWEGRIVSEPEWLLEARVVEGAPELAAAQIKEGHPHKTPLVEIVPCAVEARYAVWAQSVQGR